MAVIFSVLGKILYVLLMILCFLLVLVLLLLLCPIHYHAELVQDEKISMKGAVRWLFFLVYLPFFYKEGEFRYSIRIFGIRARRRRKREDDQEDLNDDPEDALEGEELVAMDMETGAVDINADDMDMVTEDAGEGDRTHGKRKTRKKKAKKEGFHGFSSIRGIFGKIREKSSLVSDTKAFLKEENTKQTICIIKDNVIHLLKKLKPKVFKGYIEFGTGDPCQTGQVLAVLACLYAYYGSSIEIVPDFMEKKLLGHLYVKGRIVLLTIVILVLRVIFSKGFHGFIKEVKGLKEEL